MRLSLRNAKDHARPKQPMLQCCFFKAFRISCFALRARKQSLTKPVMPFADCTSFRRGSLLCPGQPLRSLALLGPRPSASLQRLGSHCGSFVPVAASPPAALSLARLRVARAAAKTWRIYSNIIFAPYFALCCRFSTRTHTQADNIGWPRPWFLGPATAKPSGSQPFHPRSTRKAARRTVDCKPFHFVRRALRDAPLSITLFAATSTAPPRSFIWFIGKVHSSQIQNISTFLASLLFYPPG